MERGIIGLSYDISFVLIGTGNRKLLKVEVDNFGYFWVLEAQVTFITYLYTQVTFSFMPSYDLVVYSYFLLPVVAINVYLKLMAKYQWLWLSYRIKL